MHIGSRKLRIFFFFVLGIITINVLPANGAWKPSEGQYSGKGYSIYVPTNWVVHSDSAKFLITKDGERLQNISIATISVGQPLEYTSKRFSEEMLPQEAAEIYIYNLSANKAVQHIKVIENSPVLVSGVEGFKIIFAYKDLYGLTMKSMVYGAIYSGSVFTIKYEAAKRYYFDRDLVAFETIARSFRISGTPDVKSPVTSGKQDTEQLQRSKGSAEPHEQPLTAVYNMFDYFPLSTGSRWKYSDNSSHVISGTTNKNGSLVYIDSTEIQKISVETYSGPWKTYLAIYGNRSGGLFSIETVYSSPLVLGGKEMQIGWAYDGAYNFTVRDKVLKFTYRIMFDSLEDVKVPAGIFKDCLKIRTIIYGDDNTVTSDSIGWYAKHIGLVKYGVNSSGMGALAAELLEYSIK